MVSRSRSAALLVAVVLSFGCATIERWRESQRASDRHAAEENARDWLRAGEWERALSSAERAQAAPYLAPDVASESTWIKARALDELGRREESLAHFRLLRDRYPDSAHARAIPGEARAALNSDAPEPGTAESAPQPKLRVPDPRYTKHARFAGLAGDVVVACRVNEKGRPEAIRVLGPAHPLLASLAVEAVAGARLAPGEPRDPLPRPWKIRFEFVADPLE